MDIVFGTLISYGLFRLVDWFAVSNGIEILKSGVYYDEKVDLTTNDGKKTD